MSVLLPIPATPIASILLPQKQTTSPCTLATITHPSTSPCTVHLRLWPRVRRPCMQQMLSVGWRSVRIMLSRNWPPMFALPPLPAPQTEPSKFSFKHGVFIVLALSSCPHPQLGPSADSVVPIGSLPIMHLILMETSPVKACISHTVVCATSTGSHTSTQPRWAKPSVSVFRLSKHGV